MTSPVAQPVSTSALERWTAIIYALHAFSIVTGIVGTATVIGGRSSGRTRSLPPQPAATRHAAATLAELGRKRSPRCGWGNCAV